MIGPLLDVNANSSLTLEYHAFHTQLASLYKRMELFIGYYVVPTLSKILCTQNQEPSMYTVDKKKIVPLLLLMYRSVQTLSLKWKSPVHVVL